jgi:hypothetical protein
MDLLGFYLQRFSYLNQEKENTQFQFRMMNRYSSKVIDLNNKLDLKIKVILAMKLKIKCRKLLINEYKFVRNTIFHICAFAYI